MKRGQKCCSHANYVVNIPYLQICFDMSNFKSEKLNLLQIEPPVWA